jgi:two-component system, LytTR family, response regulator
MHPKPITCIAIDDEHFALEIIKLHAEKATFLELKGAFRSALEALTYLQRAQVDLIFLDINMPDLSGIDFIKTLPAKQAVIFTTAYTQYALEGYVLNVVDYLLKPIEFPRFLLAAQKAQELHQLRQKSLPIEPAEASETLFLKSGQQIYPIKISEIRFIESEANYLNIYLADDRKILTRMTLHEMMELLPTAQFIRVHKSYLVAFAHLDLIEKHQVKIKQHTIPVSKTYQDALWSRI